MMAKQYIRWFGELGMTDVPSVGGKTASLGELYSHLAAEHIRVPNGFAITAEAYRDAMTANGGWEKLHHALDDLDVRDTARLSEQAKICRDIVYEATAGNELRRQILAAYETLKGQYGAGLTLAVRSSATAEDLPNASFAGQHESYLHVAGAAGLIEACRNCFASLFTERAIVYRHTNGFDHFKVFLSVAVMKMVRSDLGASGVIFTLDTESGFRDVVFVTAAYGLGENVVQGNVDPDEFYVHKPTYAKGFRAVLDRRLGSKQMRLVYSRGPQRTREQSVSARERARFCLSDDEVLALAGYAIAIEEHYTKAAGHPMPMDIEWAKDGKDQKLYIVQARPETVASRRGPVIESFHLASHPAPRLTGRAVGEKIASGPVHVIHTLGELSSFRDGEVLVAPTTTPDWEPVMKKAAAIITDRGGRTCHAAIVARELGLAAVVGTKDATSALKSGQMVTVSCAEGETGHVYDGAVPFERIEVRPETGTQTRTEVMVNLGNPELAFRTAMLPAAGVGLARMEFIINEAIGIHPMALAHLQKVTSAKERSAIARRTAGFARPEDFFIRTLSEGIGRIAAAFYPRPVIVRLSDFKTNEYATLLGGRSFEPIENNPMLGFRGAARYGHPAYADGFALECAALLRVRKEMGLSNLKLMVPFCRREEEARKVLATLSAHGLERGRDGLEIYVMCEIPANVIRIDGFAQLFDGFSIGSNDLTQLTLGVDRDSEIVAFDFDERDPAMLEMLRLAVTGARRNHRHCGICGEAPANFPDLAAALVRMGIDSISVNPSSLMRSIEAVAAAETLPKPDAA
ncbi:MAG: phosphoenolpyruvate synthase [Alphaproteobacteria bacterium]|nr:phosphoenolpyruvate synthase [Alphaproteobacteria bacterium]